MSTTGTSTPVLWRTIAFTTQKQAQKERQEPVDSVPIAWTKVMLAISAHRHATLAIL
jgi:hypothetical protein